MKKGILVSIMGITNIGKSVQIALLIRALTKRKCGNEELGRPMKVGMVKYPVYHLSPSGPRINNYLRHQNPERLSPLEFQRLNVNNKVQFEPKLRELLESHDLVVTEMYTGTSIAYGMGDGIPKNTLINMNTGLIEPDVSILLDGQRFMKSVEAGHVFENDDEKTEKIRLIHQELAWDFGWRIIKANRSPYEVHEEIFEIVSSALKEIMVSV